MSLPTPCPGCGKVYDLGDEFHNKTIRCKFCAEVFSVGPAAPPPEGLSRAPEPAATVLQASTSPAQAPAEPPLTVVPISANKRTPPPADSGGMPYVWISLGVGAVALLLLIVGVAGVGMYWLAQRPEPAPVSSSGLNRNSPTSEGCHEAVAVRRRSGSGASRCGGDRPPEE